MKALFYMPASMEANIAAVSTIQAYRVAYEHRIRNESSRIVNVPTIDRQALQVFLSYPMDSPWTFLYRAVGNWDGFWDTPLRGQFDLVFRFDEELAYQLALPTNRHMVQAFGLQLGVEPAVLPDMRNVAEAWGDNWPEELRGPIVVGRRSGWTWLACCLGKPVVEIYPEDVPRKWLSKWSHPKYAMVRGEPSPAAVKQAVEALACRVGITVPPDLDSMVSSVFAAELAVAR